MKHFKLFTAAVACSFILLSGCQKEIDTAVNPTAAKQISELSATQGGLRTKINVLSESEQQYRNMVHRAVHVLEPTPCDANTPVSLWLDDQLSDWNGEIFNTAIDWALLDIPTYDALVFENSSANQYYGVNGEYTQQLTKGFKDLKRFWDIQSNNIIMAAMHGKTLQDRNKVIRTLVAVYRIPSTDAPEVADYILDLVKTTPQYRNGNHPIFTFNAFAQRGFSLPGVGEIPDKIIMGDGVMQAYGAVGYGDIAPQAILAHEFGHHIQFDLGIIKGGTRTPEGTRRTELMADAYAAYFLSHARGAAMQWKRVQQFLQVFFNIGDCSFTSNGHHGTPTQRMAAANWAYNLANDAQKQGHILSSQEFAILFDAELENIVKN